MIYCQSQIIIIISATSAKAIYLRPTKGPWHWNIHCGFARFFNAWTCHLLLLQQHMISWVKQTCLTSHFQFFRKCKLTNVTTNIWTPQGRYPCRTCYEKYCKVMLSWSVFILSSECSAGAVCPPQTCLRCTSQLNPATGKPSFSVSQSCQQLMPEARSHLENFPK